MKAVERLFWAHCDFDKAWRAHAAVLRATTMIRHLSVECEPQMIAALRASQGLESGFDSDFALEHLLCEINDLEGEDYFPLRKNALLGICSSFESFVKTFAAALTYESNWKSLDERKRLLHETDLDFLDRFSKADERWKCDKKQFLRDAFPWLDFGYIDRVSEVFWLRNQLTHNADRAQNDKALTVFPASFAKGELISLGPDRLRLSVQCLSEVVRLVSDETPYREAI
jgi:hypothetical protein